MLNIKINKSIIRDKILPPKYLAIQNQASGYLVFKGFILFNEI